MKSLNKISKHASITNFFLTVLLLVLLLGCSGGKPGQQNKVWDDQTKFSRKLWDSALQTKPKYILWEKCASKESCAFLNEFGPNQYKTPFKIDSLERCYGSDCDQLTEFGRTPHYKPMQGAFTYKERCIGEECERFADYGPNSTIRTREDPENRCYKDECDKLESFGGNGIIPYTKRNK
ncbi:MAG: hypothetical protein HQM14_06635 [SAR324 cluster bacterium]|nr:hypothetical protein [SAR324 cluster bacterium]